jgi:hypothetical protein
MMRDRLQHAHVATAEALDPKARHLTDGIGASGPAQTLVRGTAAGALPPKAALATPFRGRAGFAGAAV